jgi:hypothetical protein
MGLQGKGEIWTAPQKRKGISPLPCTSNVESWRGRSWAGGAPVVGTAEGPGTTNVEMVADEVCCWLPNNGDWQWRPAATSFNAKHAMFEIRISSRGMRFASKRTLSCELESR